MSESKVSICNKALSLIGASSIISLHETTTNAKHCLNVYDQTRRALLRDHPWSCARKRAILMPISTYPTFGYRFAFVLPQDFIRLLETNSSDFQLETRHILANVDAVQLVYSFDNDNEELWDALLVEAMILKLTSKLCKPITGSDAAGQSAEEKYENLIRRARAINAQENPSQTLQYTDSEFLRSRY